MRRGAGVIRLSVAPGSVTSPDRLRVGYDWKAQNSRRLELAAQLLPQNDELLKGTGVLRDALVINGKVALLYDHEIRLYDWLDR